MLEVVSFQTSKDQWLNLFCLEYEKKIKNFINFRLKLIKSPPFKREFFQKKKKEEEKLLMNHLKSSPFILLDEGGEAFSSLQWSQFLAQQLESQRNVKVVVGGSFGVTDLIKEKASRKIKISDMTTSHQVALVFLLEQIYRGLTIKRGLPYHND